MSKFYGAKMQEKPGESSGSLQKAQCSDSTLHPAHPCKTGWLNKNLSQLEITVVVL